MRREPNRRPGARAGALVLVTVAALATGCASSPRTGAPTPPTPPQPQSLQADSVASQEFGLLAGGGWAPAWALWSDSAQQAISQADFVRLNTECRPPAGIAYVIDRSTTLDPATVRVDWHRAGATGSNTLLYQAGRWRFVPDEGALAEYRLGVEPLVQQRRAAGSCH
ncbi:hypothetical protein GCM10009665_59220 [Kitasatospora nipponensis]|uniref:Lipoprotein n=1 Tax=Kitasatospora nipponensis TaxID=258049 RepID=A0ABN1WUU0_9ACTN